MPDFALRIPRPWPTNPPAPPPPGRRRPARWHLFGAGSIAPEYRHSRRVALLKRLLPAVGIALMLLIAVWPRLAPLWDRMRLAFPAIDLRDARELRMLNPRYAGLDRLGRPYVVTAAVGLQVPDRQDLMSLDQPRADLKTHSGADVVLTAATGVYQSQGQLLDLFREVTLTHQNGTRLMTDKARLDIAHDTAEGDDPVEGHGPSGDVKSAGFRILDKGDTVIFTGHSDMLLRGAKTVAHPAAPQQLPPAVAAMAVRTAAEAKPVLAAAVSASAPQHPKAHVATLRQTAPASKHRPTRPPHAGQHKI